jgi:hypothetical protein
MPLLIWIATFACMLEIATRPYAAGKHDPDSSEEPGS